MKQPQHNDRKRNNSRQRLYFRKSRKKTTVFRVVEDPRDQHLRLIRIAEIKNDNTLVESAAKPPNATELEAIELHMVNKPPDGSDSSTAEAELLAKFGHFVQDVQAKMPDTVTAETAEQLSFAFLDLRQTVLDRIKIS